MQVRWRTLSYATRVNLEAIIAHTLATSLHTDHTANSSNPLVVVATTLSNQKTIDNNHKSQFFALVLAMGQFKIAYVDLTPSTRTLLGDKNKLLTTFYH